VEGSSVTNRDDTDRAVLGKLPTDPREDAKMVVDAPVLRTERDLIAGAMRRALNPDRRVIIPTGHYEIDRKTGGFAQGTSWLIGADTGKGKSTLSVAFVDQFQRQGSDAIIVSLEDAEELYADRLLLRRARRSHHEKLNADHLRLGELTADEHRLMADVASKAGHRPIFLDAVGRSGEWVARVLGEMLDAMPNVGLVVLDYIGEADSEAKNEDRRNEMRKMGRLARMAVKSRRRCLIILSQITLDEKNPDKFPRRSQIRDCKDLVNAAEVVGMLGIAQVDVTDDRGDVKVHAGKRALLLDKVKRGHTGFVELHWDDEAACFCDVVDDRYSETDPRDPPLGRSWSPGAPAPRPFHEPEERDDDIPDGFGGLPRN
jgi:replicative DNA helicase